MSNEKTLRTLQRMIERMERTLQYCQNESFASFQSNLMLQEACVFNLLQIGELAHNGLAAMATDLRYAQSYCA